jgi:hypothetical protein
VSTATVTSNSTVMPMSFFDVPATEHADVGIAMDAATRKVSTTVRTWLTTAIRNAHGRPTHPRGCDDA